MGGRRGLAWTAATLVALTLALTGCTSYNTKNESRSTGPNCSEVFDSVVHHVRIDDTLDAINYELDWLDKHCSKEYGVVVGYLSARGEALTIGPGTCESLSQYIASDAIALLHEDGLCADGGIVQAELWPDGGLGWDVAQNYVGTRQRICGPLISLRNTDDGAFLNLGKDYPSPDRFTFIIWGVALEAIEDGATICGKGNIYLYDGVTQVELASPEDIEIWL